MGSESAIDRLRASGQVRRLPIPGASAGDVMEVVGPVQLPIEVDGAERIARWFVGRWLRSDGTAGERTEEVSVLQFGEASREDGVRLVRIHSACLTGDTLGSMRCDCGPQLRSAIRQIADASEGGLLIYMTTHEGRGIGLWSKAAAYLLQADGLDTYAANRALAFPDDQRDFRLAAAVLEDLLPNRRFELLTNNPLKLNSLERFGVTGATRRALVEGSSPHNACYLRAKREHGHLLPT
ncbi:MAG: GTP cyclohydrolase II [Myxococcota bacterium]